MAAVHDRGLGRQAGEHVAIDHLGELGATSSPVTSVRAPWPESQLRPQAW
ncbi:MAG TPA: hypothetical protein VH478_20790 [Trebonia sp.]|jgi:hypothetical protein|nr:hypothetical protein [Trebonia sp.]